MKNVTPKNNKGGCGLLAGIFLLAPHPNWRRARGALDV